MQHYLRWALKWLADPTANPKTSKKWIKMNQEMTQVMINMKNTVNKNTRSRAAMEKAMPSIFCQTVRSRVPDDCMWNFKTCKKELNRGEDCYVCVKCSKPYHDLCQVGIGNVVCTQTREPNLRDPGQTMDHNEDETIRTSVIVDESMPGLPIPQ